MKHRENKADVSTKESPAHLMSTCNCDRSCWYCQTINREVEAYRLDREELYAALEGMLGGPHDAKVRKVLNAVRTRGGYLPLSVPK